MRGTINLARSVFENPIVGKDPVRFRAWCWLLMKARWKPGRYNTGRMSVELERGQLCTSVRVLAEEWGMSKSSVDRFLTRLKTGTGDGPMIETHTGTGQLVISICNYDKYQSDPDDAGTEAGTVKGGATGTAPGQHRDIKEERDNKEKDIGALPGLDPPKQKSSRFRPVFDADLGIREEVAGGFIEHRRAKKSPLTKRALTLLCKQLRKIREAGHDPNDALDMAINSNWQTVECDWFLRRVRQSANAHTPRTDDAFLEAQKRKWGLS